MCVSVCVKVRLEKFLLRLNICIFFIWATFFMHLENLELFAFYVILPTPVCECMCVCE